MTLPISGHQSVAEVKDLIRAKDLEIQTIDNNYIRLNRPDWKNSQEGRAWLSDWSALKSRYVSAKSPLAHAIAEWTPIPDSLIDDQAEYDSILEALENQTGLLAGFNGPQEGILFPGSLQDLFNRLSKISPTLKGQDKAIGKLIQPNTNSDAAERLNLGLKEFDPIGDKKASEDWKKWIEIGAFAAAGVFAIVAAKEVFGPFNIARKVLPSRHRLDNLDSLFADEPEAARAHK